MNFTISHRQFAQLVRGQIVKLDNDTQIAIADIGYSLLQFELTAAELEFKARETDSERLPLANPKFHKGDVIACLDVERKTALERGFAIYPGERYVVKSDSYMWKAPDSTELELVELEKNGDGEPDTHYPVKFFRHSKRAL